MNDHPRELTEDDKLSAFRAAVTNTCGAVDRWAERRALGLNDEDLVAALAYELGTAGGSCGHSRYPNIDYQKAGLKIWAAGHQTCPCGMNQSFKVSARSRLRDGSWASLTLLTVRYPCSESHRVSFDQVEGAATHMYRGPNRWEQCAQYRDYHKKRRAIEPAFL